jgi:hypothetical protein
LQRVPSVISNSYLQTVFLRRRNLLRTACIPAETPSCCRRRIISKSAINNRVGHARLTKTGILEQGIRQLRITRPLPTGAAVQQPVQILRLPGWIVPAWGRQAQVCLEAVCVTLQYAMDLGEPIFDVVHHYGMRKQPAAQQQQQDKRQKQR